MTLKIGVYLSDGVVTAVRSRAQTLRHDQVRLSSTRRSLASSSRHPPRSRAKRCSRLSEPWSNAFGGCTRETEVVSETLALFVRYFLMVTPPVPESERPAAEGLGRERYQVFIRRDRPAPRFGH